MPILSGSKSILRLSTCQPPILWRRDHEFTNSESLDNKDFTIIWFLLHIQNIPASSYSVKPSLNHYLTSNLSYFVLLLQTFPDSFSSLNCSLPCLHPFIDQLHEPLHLVDTSSPHSGWERWTCQNKSVYLTNNSNMLELSSKVLMLQLMFNTL